MVSAMAAAVTSIVVALVTALITHRLTVVAERQKWYRELGLKYAEASSSDPQRASLMARQFGIAILMVGPPPALSATSLPMEVGTVPKLFVLPYSRMLIGRDETAEIVIQDESVSRQHALITTTESSVYIQDMHSRNGVTVNGTAIERKRKLEAGDRIEIGSTTLTMHPLSD